MGVTVNAVKGIRYGPTSMLQSESNLKIDIPLTKIIGNSPNLYFMNSILYLALYLPDSTKII